MQCSPLSNIGALKLRVASLATSQLLASDLRTGVSQNKYTKIMSVVCLLACLRVNAFASFTAYYATYVAWVCVIFSVFCIGFCISLV